MANPFDSTVLQNVSVRPLNKGMYQNLPSNGIPDGGFWRIQNYRVEPAGLARRGGFIDFDANLGTGNDKYDEQLFDIIYFYQRSGGAEQLLLGSKNLYIMNGAGKNVAQLYRPIIETVISNTASAGTPEVFTITLAGTEAEASRVRPGDIVTLNSVDEYIATGATHDGTNIVLTVTGSGVAVDDYAAQAVTLDEQFITLPGQSPEYAVLPSVGETTDDKVVICDQAERGLYQYTSGVLEPFVIDSTDGAGGTVEFVVGAKTITYFDDRLWLGNVEDVDGNFRQRIRWSDATNFGRIAPASYIDLPYTEGQLLRLLPLGALLVAYFSDAIYIGRRTNMSGQPYFFERVEAGNSGILSSRAVVRHVDTHYFVGYDNIYSLSGNTGIQIVGTPIIEEALYFTKSLELTKYIQVEHDPVTKSIVFLFPDIIEVGLEQFPSVATRLWRLYYETGTWAYDEVSFANEKKSAANYLFTAVLPSKFYAFGRSWGDWEDLGFDASWTGEADPDTPGYVAGDVTDESFQEWVTWTALADEERLDQSLKIGVYSAPLGKEVILEEAIKSEADTIGGVEYPVWALIESPDHDTGMPDYTKTVTRLGFKAMHIYSERESSLIEVGGVFTLNISDSMGYKWKRPLTLRFKRGYNEGYANFRSTGSTFRFKLINSQIIAPYRLSEYVMRMVGRGLQVEN